MPLESPKLLTMMLAIAISMAMLVSRGQARFQPQVQAKVEAEAQVQFVLPDPLKCWGSIREAGVCANEVEDLILNGQIPSSVISPACCTALVDLGQNCWSNLFPFNPFFPAAVESYCAAVNGGSDLAPAPAENGAKMGSDSVDKSFSWGA
ncbi:hypothetical protein Vadar_009769 [Vaccinium darrowii]|uniref:Uncharacterized protein n=1 Tax=Vaccinium darrowii TaxID=229202 RepID=A0ACB7Z490_9ERIC|nr:hypothetical protein Vadar_009769 [Vaccinium darrowii]